MRTPDATSLPDTFTGSEENIRASVLNYPDYVVFDLDPYIYSGKEKAGGEPELNRSAFSKAAEVAYALKEVLDQLALSSLHQDIGKDGVAHLCAGAAPIRLLHHPQGLRGDRPVPHAADAQRHYHGLDGEPAGEARCS